MTCRHFIQALEEYFETHPDAAGSMLSRELTEHTGQCAKCERDYRQAVKSRILLASLRATRRPPADDPYFLTRVKARIAAQQQLRAFWPFRVAWRDVATALAVFLITLGTFVYDIHRVESPNADEAIAIEAPHVNAVHPADDHQPQTPDAIMLTLLQP